MDLSIYTDRAAKVVKHALELAGNMGHRYFTPEHIMYALLQDKGFAENFKLSGGNIDIMERELTDFFFDNISRGRKGCEIEYTEDVKRVFERAETQAYTSGRGQVEVEYLFSAILSLEESYAVYFLLKQNVDLLSLIGALSRQTVRENAGEQYCMSGVPHEEAAKEADREWQKYVECLNDTCMDKNPLIGREKELERTIQILCRMNKNNVMHVGEPGVGKTAIVYGLARMIEEEKVPDEIKDAKIYMADMGTMVAGTKYRGDFEKRFKEIMDGISGDDNPVVYIDEIHNIVGAGATGDGNLDMSNLLKPYLADGKIRFIGATTYEEYRKYITKNKSLMRRFGKVDISEPSISETVHILEGLRERYEAFHGVKYKDGVFEYAAELSAKFINERFLPDKAIDLIDEAGAYRKLHPAGKKTEYVDKKLIDDMLAITCNIPKRRVEQDDIKQLASLEKNMKKVVYGQDEAIIQVCNAIKFSKAGLNEDNKPVAGFLFAGPTGVGKTETAKALADELGVSLVRFDMSEYAEKHTVAKLIGSPTGYVGYEDGGLLTDEIRKHPYSVLLLDEIEKAHPDIFNVLLQVLDYATLTDNQGRKADFRNVVIIMTSNAGATGVGKMSVGFGGTLKDESAITDAVKELFKPEFRNRLSGMIVFHGMDDDMAYKIAVKKTGKLVDKMARKGVELGINKAAIRWIKDKGITKEYGAREIDRVIDKELKPMLVEALLFGKLKNGGKCSVTVRDDKLALSC